MYIVHCTKCNLQVHNLEDTRNKVIKQNKKQKGGKCNRPISIILFFVSFIHISKYNNTEFT